MSITALPPPPQRSDPANFAVRADAFFAALPTFVIEFNEMVPAAVSGLVTGSFKVVGSQATVQSTSPSFSLWKDATPTKAGRVAFNASSPDSLQFDLYNGSTWVTSMMLDTLGNVLIGTTSAIASDVKLNAKNTTASTATAGLWNASTAGDAVFLGFGTEGGYTSRGSVDFNRAGTLTRYNTTSDATLKTLLGDAPQAKSLQILDSVRLREFAWKEDPTNKPQIGVLAQELHETYRGAVSVGGEYTTTDEAGEEVTRYRPWAVDKTAFTFHLIAGYQAQKAQIAELQASLAALTARVTALEAA